MRMTWKARGTVALGIIALALVVFATAGGAGARPATDAGPLAAFPRSETLYTTGTMWSPYSDLNPFKTWDYVTGTQGFVYESLFNYDPLTDKFVPWLASKGTWVTKNKYSATVRSGVKFSDGKALTAADVKFSFEVGKIPTATFHQLWTSGLKSITTSGPTVTFTFSGTPNYQEWNGYLYQIPIVPQHVWKTYDETTIVSGNLADTSKLIGTGPYVYHSGLNSTESFAWVKRSNWWGTKALGLEPKPKYVVDIYNGSNSASLANLLAGNIDLSNNFMPGIDQQVGGKIGTYFSKPPFMLSANTAWLVPNMSKAPMSEVGFRKALAASVNVSRIVNADYGNIVSPANPTGLLPVWNKYIDKAVVKKSGFAYSITKAKTLLRQAGYKDVNNDGYVENKDGSKLDLSLIVPNGWSDWMTAAQIISDSAKDAGIRITPAYPDYSTLVDDRNHGRFDLAINNEQQIGNTPWTYYNYLFRLPILDSQTTVNFARYSNPTAWKLTQQLDQTPATDVAAMKKITSQLQAIFLRDLPVIPLWYNGVWAQWNTTTWKGWPSSTGKGMQTIPALWRGYVQLGGIQMLSHLKAGGL